MRHKRKSVRYEFSAQVDISRNHKRFAYGSLNDISVDGVGFTASPALEVGETYLISIRGLASFQCKIMHCSGLNRYGAQLLLTGNRKMKLAEALERYNAANGIASHG